MRTRSWTTSSHFTFALGFAVCCAGTASGCGTSASSLCDEICDCEGCSDAEHDDCVDDIEDAEKKAEDEGCDDAFGDYLDCIDSEFECIDGKVDADGCDSEAKAVAECVGTPVSVNDPCTTAAAICGGQGTQQGDCTGATACAAQCINSANSCDIAMNAALQKCIAACGT